MKIASAQRNGGIKRHKGVGESFRMAEQNMYGGGGDTSGKTDCGQIVMSLGSHQFSRKTSASHVLAKAATIFTHSLLWGSLSTYAWNPLASEGTQPSEMLPGS